MQSCALVESMRHAHSYQGIWDLIRVSLSKVYLPELLERVSAGEVLEVDSNLSICINFTVFSFVMAYNNKNVGCPFGCNFTLCVPNQHLSFSKFLYLKVFGFNRYECWCFGDKDSFSIPQTEELVFFDFKVHKKERLRQILRYITTGSTDHYPIKWQCLFKKLFFTVFSIYIYIYIHLHKLLKEHWIWVWIRAAYTFCMLICLDRYAIAYFALRIPSVC